MLERKAAVGKTCEPRLKSQRIEGKAREAGWEEMMGRAKVVRAKLAPVARREVVIVVVWMAAWRRDMVMYRWGVWGMDGWFG